MPSNYAGTGTTSVASPTDTVCTLTGETTTRGWIYYFCLSSSATPADNTIKWIVQRCTTSGTPGSSPVPEPLDEAEAAALCDFDQAQSAEPTYTAAAEVWENAVNQRMTLQFWSNPGGELVVPATADNGFGWQPVHGSFTGAVEVTVHWTE